jgi:endonuclease/exonuclease/phosphatase family metal-dependent hydrolase
MAGVKREDQIDSRQAERFDPTKIRNAEQQAGENIPEHNRSTDGLDDHPISASVADGKDPSANIDLARTKEEASQQQGFYRQTKQKAQLSRKGITGLLNKGGPTAAIVGLLITPIVLFSALLPLKLFGMVANMADAAGAVPGYAVERRVEYLVTRAFSVWLIKKSSGANITDSELANKAIFCKNASIGCSLTMTRIGDYFDKKYSLDLKQNLNPDGTRKVTVTPKGRDSLGQKARGWTIDVEKTIDGQTVSKVQKTITSNAEMKREIRHTVNRQMATKNLITRYIARKVLMKRYGVTHWRGFEQTSNKYADKKAAFKAGIARNTLGRVSPKMASYLACLSGGASCEKLKDSYQSKIDESERKKDADGNYTETPEEYEKRKARNKAYKEAAGIAEVELPEGETASKFLSRQLMAKLAAGAGIAGVLDLLFGAIGAVDKGALESVMYDIRSNAYVGYAFGDDTGIIPNIERFKAGNGSDPDVMPILAEQFENIEQSPVWQAENGMIKGGQDGNWSRICDKDGKPEKIVLKGQYVCPERQLAQDVSGFMNTPSGKTIGSIAEVWNDTAGLIFDAINVSIGFIMDKLGINALIEEVFGGSIDKLVQWMMSLFFDIPAVGGEATGDQNYDALSAATWISQNGMMENGVDSDGDLLGGGGRPLSNSEVAAIQIEQNREDQEFFNSQPQIAKIFDVNLRGSFMNAFVARIPMSTFTSSASVATIPSVAVTNFASALSPSASAARATPKNPHNIPLYGYTSEDKALSASPADAMYSEDSCEQSAEAREESYTLDRSKYPIKMYTKSDPCALEKMAIGTFLYDMGVKDDPNSFKDIDGSGEETETSTEGISGVNVATFNIFHMDDQSTDVWQGRLTKSVKALNDKQIDIAGLQEARPAQQKALNRAEFGGDIYDMYPATVTNGRSANENPDSVVIWNNQKFELTEGRQEGIAYEGSSRKVNIVKLKYIENGANGPYIWVLNTHDPTDGRSGTTGAADRLSNAKKYANIIKELKEDAPVILTGDFNSRMSIINSGNQPLDGKRENLTYCVMTRSNLMVHASDSQQGKDGECPSQRDVLNRNDVDHIFITPDMTASNYGIAPRGKDTPNGNGADHDMVYASIAVPGISNGSTAQSAEFSTVAFPLKGVKSTVLNPEIFKDNSTLLSDHPYTAYDILADTGTEVVAFADGEVSYVSTDKCPGKFLTIWNEQAGIGITYMHLSTHIGKGTKVKAGDYVGKVGSAEQGCGTPHLHIDASTDKIRQPCSREACAESVKNTFRSLGKDLFNTYQQLPE